MQPVDIVQPVEIVHIIEVVDIEDIDYAEQIYIFLYTLLINFYCFGLL